LHALARELCDKRFATTCDGLYKVISRQETVEIAARFMVQVSRDLVYPDFVPMYLGYFLGVISALFLPSDEAEQEQRFRLARVM
jgi:hypothetical protein